MIGTFKYNIRKLNVFVVAARRLTFEMAAYQIKRAVRNYTVPLVPSLYYRYICRVASKLPAIEMCADGEHTLMDYVIRYYESVNDARTLDEVASGSFTFFGVTHRFGSLSEVDWHHQVQEETNFHLWRQKLNHLGFIGAMLGQGKKYHKSIEALLDSFGCYADFSNRGYFTSVWFTYSASHRVLALLSGLYSSHKRGPISDTLFSKLEKRIRFDVAFVIANIEHELKNNHVERNLAALCLYFSCVSKVPDGLQKKIDFCVFRYLNENILADGMMIERSAMYQGLTVLSLRIFMESDFLERRTRAFAGSLYHRALKAWWVLTHPDGEISLFNDSWYGEVPRTALVEKEVSLLPLEVLSSAGYARIRKGHIFLIFDAGAIGPEWNPGHGHSDFLAVEIDVAGSRFIVDPGTSEYSHGPQRQRQRAANQHNGPSIKGRDFVEYMDCFKVGKYVDASLSSISSGASGFKLTGALDLVGASINRSIEVHDNQIILADEWQLNSGDGVVRLLIDGSWGIAGYTSTDTVIFQKGMERVRLVVDTGCIESIDVDRWSCQYLRHRPATRIDLLPVNGKGNAQVLKWRLDVEK